MPNIARVLHVDDDLNSREVVKRVLEGLGYEAISVSDIERADAALHTYGDSIRFIICERTLDEENDGLHWAHELNEREGKNKVIMLSSDVRRNGLQTLNKTKVLSEMGYLAEQLRGFILALPPIYVTPHR